MSGGSLDYLYCKEIGDIAPLFCEALNKLESLSLKETDAYKDIDKIYKHLLSADICMNNKVRSLLRTIEWVMSGDSGDKNIIEDVKNYNNI